MSKLIFFGVSGLNCVASDLTLKHLMTVLLISRKPSLNTLLEHISLFGLSGSQCHI